MARWVSQPSAPAGIDLVALGVTPPELETEAVPAPIWCEQAPDGREHALEQQLLDADVVVKVLEVAQPLDPTGRVRRDRGRSVAR